MNKAKIVFFILFYILLFSCPVFAQFELDLETGAVFSGYNNVRIPGKGGTLFSLSEELKTNPSLFYRILVAYDFNSRHQLSVLFAPLSIISKGELDHELIFAGKKFPPNTPLRVKYKFNSYRLIYCYDFIRKEKLEAGIGFTAKIRDAEVSVRGNGNESQKANVGFVPIIHFRFIWNLSKKFSFLLDGDALAAPQGRAEDILVALTAKVSERIRLRIGYRILEGGANNDEVYNFALFHYASLGMQIQL